MLARDKYSMQEMDTDAKYAAPVNETSVVSGLF